jgi:hypothetical protein
LRRISGDFLGRLFGESVARAGATKETISRKLTGFSGRTGSANDPRGEAGVIAESSVGLPRFGGTHSTFNRCPDRILNGRFLQSPFGEFFHNRRDGANEGQRAFLAGQFLSIVIKYPSTQGIPALRSQCSWLVPTTDGRRLVFFREVPVSALRETDPVSDSSEPGSRNPLRRLLVITDLVYVGLIFVAWFPAVFSVMLASGGNTLRVRIQIYSQLTFPFVLLFSVVVPWIFYRLGMFRVAKAILFLPLVNVVLILLYVVIPGWLA